ncbi:hypothetical protein [Sphingobium cloacae]|uniref:hypothetical protein n=2 Tax=Sphingobium cloacae TaxID=120107 RepID=UPI000F4D3698|nr:hypothetical protein [Sphingobium cloacae]
MSTTPIACGKVSVVPVISVGFPAPDIAIHGGDRDSALLRSASEALEAASPGGISTVSPAYESDMAKAAALLSAVASAPTLAWQPVRNAESACEILYREALLRTVDAHGVAASAGAAVQAIERLECGPALDCLIVSKVPDLPAEMLRTSVAGPPAPAAASPDAVAGATLNEVAASGQAPGGSALQIGFEFGNVTPTGNAQAILDQIATLAASGPVNVMIVARDTENWDPAKRDSLLDERLAAIVSALANRGIAPAAIAVTWRPDRADTSIHRDGPGLQEIARIQVRK